MADPIKRAVLFVNLHKKNTATLSKEITRVLEGRGITVTVFSFDGRPETPAAGDWDIAFSIGGDGTVLYTARVVSPGAVPILPINMGTLGFIAAVHADEWEQVFEKWLNGKTRISPRCMMEVAVERGGKKVAEYNCLNDAVISAEGIAKLINLDVLSQIDEGENTALGSYRCDGLIISTATGSTAYSMAAGGPILDPEMEAVIVNPICPFSISSRPLVLISRQTLTVTVAQEQRSGVLLTVDGQDTFDLVPTDKVVISQAPYHAQLISPGRDSYYEALRNKLHWSGNPSGGRNA